MYLSRRHYVKNWEHMKPEEKHTITILKNGKVAEHIMPSRVSEITEDIGYWRKANAIHNWFVANVQDSEDDCRDAYVSFEKLRELLETVNKVLKASKLVSGKVKNGYTYEKGKEKPNLEEGKIIQDPSVAQELLPTGEEFFFGSTDYDEYYIQDLKETKKILEAVIKEGDVGSIYYHSSW